jgi:DnaJ-class molecular chaperone
MSGLGSTYSEHLCATCEGYGAITCGCCAGTGQAPADESGALSASAPHACPECRGKGALGCSDCHGKGRRGQAAASLDRWLI